MEGVSSCALSKSALLTECQKTLLKLDQGRLFCDFSLTFSSAIQQLLGASWLLLAATTYAPLIRMTCIFVTYMDVIFRIAIGKALSQPTGQVWLLKFLHEQSPSEHRIPSTIWNVSNSVTYQLAKYMCILHSSCNFRPTASSAVIPLFRATPDCSFVEFYGITDSVMVFLSSLSFLSNRLRVHASSPCR